MKLIPIEAFIPNINMVDAPDVFFDNMKFEFESFKKQGFFKKRKSKAIFIYQIKTDKSTKLGFISGLDIGDIRKNKLKVHENTLSYKEKRLTGFLLQRKHLIKPVLAAYPQANDITKILQHHIKSNKPCLDITLNKGMERHRLWPIEKLNDVKKIVKIARKKIPKSYIADGHHRSSTVMKIYADSSYATRDSDKAALVAFFSFDQLNIYGFNRVISGIDLDSALAKMGKYFKIKPMGKPIDIQKKHCINCCIHSDWYRLKWKKKYRKRKKYFTDIDLFNQLIVNKMFGITNIHNDYRIAYVDGAKGVKEIVKEINNSPTKIGFSFYPLTPQKIMSVADNNKVLPPKSSFFIPRIKNGIIVKKL